MEIKAKNKMKNLLKILKRIRNICLVIMIFAQIALAKDSKFKVCDIQIDHFSKDEHVTITICDTLDLTRLKIDEENLLDYNIYLYVHPLNAEGWWRQNPSLATKYWTAQAYLGGIGQNSATHNEVFQIVAVISTETPPEKVNKLKLLKLVNNLHVETTVRSITVKRHR